MLGQKKKIFTITFVFLILTILVGTVFAGDTVTVNGHQLDFIVVENDTPGANQSSWYYKVTSGTAPALSHITFEIAECMEIIEAGTWDGNDTSTRDPNGATIELGNDPQTGVNGVKFDDGFLNGEMRFYYFTVNGNFASGDITVGFKDGDGGLTGFITGPNTSCDPTAVNLNNLDTANSNGMHISFVMLAGLLGIGTYFILRRRVNNLS